MTVAPRAVSISAAIALVLAAVWLFWPLALGGSTTYVATHGISMEPRFHTGDLGILRSADTYSVGDVVAYRSKSLDTVVMHRIVAMDGDRFVIQGDNNSWLDEDHPSQDQVLGTLFLRIPSGGKALAAMSSPAMLVVLAGAALTLVGVARRPRSRHSARGARRRRSAQRPSSFSMPTRALARQVAMGSRTVALVAAVGGTVLVAMPSTQHVSSAVQVTQQGAFSYTGSAQPGTTYPDGVVSTGDTIWTRLAHGLTVSFTNTVGGPHLVGVRGAMRLDVTVAAADGWSAYLNSSPDVALDGGALTATATVGVDTARASSLLSKHYAEIGTPVAPATLVVTPVVATVGTASGVPFEAGSPDPLTFGLDATSMRLAGAGKGSTLKPSTKTQVTVDEIVPRRFSVLGVTIPIGLARIVAAAVLVLAMLTLAAGAWIGRTGRGDIADQFLVRHADRILPVAAFSPGPTVIDVADVESLHRVAERFDTVVLHHAGPDEDVFAVRDVDATYRLVIPGMPERQRGKPPVPPPAPAPLPDDATAPLPVVVPGPLSGPGGLWGHRFA
jgi:signal peptidase I